jgi:hypothetical protein
VSVWWCWRDLHRRSVACLSVWLIYSFTFPLALAAVLKIKINCRREAQVARLTRTYDHTTKEWWFQGSFLSTYKRERRSTKQDSQRMGQRCQRWDQLSEKAIKRENRLSVSEESSWAKQIEIRIWFMRQKKKRGEQVVEKTRVRGIRWETESGVY